MSSASVNVTLSAPLEPPNGLWRVSLLPLTTLAGLYGLYILSTYGSRAKHLPPGPPTLPVIGNLAVFPRAFLHLKFTQWQKQYGEVFSLKVMDNTIIVLNTPSAVREIIDRRSISSSNRPKSIIADMITHGLNFGTCRYPDERWSVLRKSAMRVLNNQNIRKHRDYHRAEASQLMFDLVHDPQNWYTHIQRAVFSFGFGIVYGCRSPLITSEDVSDIIYVHPQFIDALEFGRLPPVDLFPILKLVPERFAKWKRIVKNIGSLHDTMYDRLLRKVESRMARGESTPGLMEEAIKEADEWGLDRELLMHLGGVLLAGMDTSSAALQVVILSLVNFPDAQKKAQEEIDRVVGSDRVPTWRDIPDLPYTMAFLEETMRFRPVGPLGLPHEMAQDENVDGILYPKGAVVFINTWAMFHDERYFDDADEFIPERFLKHVYGVKDPKNDDVARRPNMLFGGGRRRLTVTPKPKSQEMNICNLIWAFDFLPALDATGQPKFPDINGFSPGLTGNPLPFDCKINPRSAQRVEMIKQEFTKASEFLAPYELELSDKETLFNSTYRGS
ncbi:cytochrome P450 [Gautieria morchelliformis]|nr:cytochrome P450 [Gautieria morchelliformis]